MSAPNPDPLGPILHKLASCIRMLLSANNHERVAGIHGVQRILQTIGEDKEIDIHALANRIEKPNGGLTDADKQGISAKVQQAYTDGYADGVRMAESKQHGSGAFRNSDGTPDWREVALYVQREKHKIRRLSDWDNEFIDDMASRTVRPNYEPSVKQHQQLHRLFFKLGGKVT